MKCLLVIVGLAAVSALPFPSAAPPSEQKGVSQAPGRESREEPLSALNLGAQSRLGVNGQAQFPGLTSFEQLGGQNSLLPGQSGLGQVGQQFPGLSGLGQIGGQNSLFPGQSGQIGSQQLSGQFGQGSQWSGLGQQIPGQGQIGGQNNQFPGLSGLGLGNQQFPGLSGLGQLGGQNSLFPGQSGLGQVGGQLFPGVGQNNQFPGLSGLGSQQFPGQIGQQIPGQGLIGSQKFPDQIGGQNNQFPGLSGLSGLGQIGGLSGNQQSLYPFGQSPFGQQGIFGQGSQNPFSGMTGQGLGQPFGFQAGLNGQLPFGQQQQGSRNPFGSFGQIGRQMPVFRK